MHVTAASVFRDALQGLKFLHDNSWLHGDVKPDNIGVTGTPPRAVLLDLGGALNIRGRTRLPATPGVGGTVGYLAPEREMQGFDQTADIWAMGGVGDELTYGHHPWRFSVNPSRPGTENERTRPAFDQKYGVALGQLQKNQPGLGGSKDFICRKWTDPSSFFLIG